MFVSVSVQACWEFDGIMVAASRIEVLVTASSKGFELQSL